MSERVVELKRKPKALKVWGVGRDSENDKAVIVCFDRKLTDDELRFFHEVCERSAPLMPEPPR